jgi:hypothetical protein
MENIVAKEIRDLQTYRNEFSSSNRNLRKAALKQALDIRKFEIELYWKRATYFWTLIAASFAGYFALWASKQPNYGLILLVNCIGIVLSIGWYLVNRGSKYWHTNWERHVDILEDEFMGPLYKTTLAKEEFKLFSIRDGYPFSVSKINQIVSLFIVLVWLGLAVRSLMSAFLPKDSVHLISYLGLGLMTLIFAFLLFRNGRSSREDTSRKINMRKCELQDTDDKKKA